jgi:hypothetical protein
MNVSGGENMHIRPVRGRAARLIATAALLASPLLAVVIAPTPANAEATYDLLKTSTFPASEPVGWSTCQHETLTLPKLSSSNRYAWSELFPEESSNGLTNYHQSFSGKFYWTICVASMKGISNSYAYYEYSLLTGDTAACENQGHCTTYELETHYLFAGGKNLLWGSELFVVPADECSFEACDGEGSVTVTTS